MGLQNKVAPDTETLRSFPLRMRLNVAGLLPAASANSTFALADFDQCESGPQQLRVEINRFHDSVQRVNFR